MWNPLRRLRIRDQIVASMTLVIVVLALAVGTAVLLNSRQEATERAQEANKELVHQLNSAMASLQSEMMDITSLPYVSQAMSTIIVPSTQGHAQERSLEALYAIMLSKSYINFIATTSPNSPGYYLATDNSFGLQPYDQLLKSPRFAEFIRSGADFDCFLLSKDDTSLVRANRTNKLLFIRTLKDIRQSFRTVGYLLVGVPLERVSQGYLGLNSEHLSVGLIDGRGQSLARSGIDIAPPPASFGATAAPSSTASSGPGTVFAKDAPKAGTSSFRVGSVDYLMVYSRDNMLGWTTYYVTDPASMAPGVENLAITIFLVATASVGVFFIVASIFTNTIVSPLDRLRASMRRFEGGDFTEHVEVDQDDEIGQVLRGYNRMVHQIRTLITQNYEVRVREKDAELTVLQSQMNPHFIYNTLDLLYWRAQAAGASDSALGIHALSQMLRSSVRRGHRWIELRDEGEFLKNYLWLQSELMGSRLDQSLDFDEAVLGYKVPRFILQPLVENALVHGLEGRPEGGSVHVAARLLEQRLHVVIADDGQGMEPETAQELFFGAGTGHAVSNIRERLDIYFPDDWYWQVDTAPGAGCRIELSLPAVTEPTSVQAR